MASLIFESGRYIAFLGVFFFVIFGLHLWAFRRALDKAGVALEEDDNNEEPEGAVTRRAVDLGGTVHYLRRRDYEPAGGALQRTGQYFRERIIWPFYLGIWCFCFGLALMSATFGFVLFG